MPVLKSTSSPIQPRAFSLRDVEAQARAILARAQQQADALLAAAQVEADSLRKEAREFGLIEGRAEGLRVGEEAGLAAGKEQATIELRPQLLALVKTLSAAAQQIENSRKQLMASAAIDVCSLAVSIARKVVHRAAASSDRVLTDTLAQALKFVIGQNDVCIAVHPSQELLLKQAIPALQQTWPALKHVEIRPDEAVLPGGARILTRHGEVDATLDGMVDRIAAELCGGEA